MPETATSALMSDPLVARAANAVISLADGNDIEAAAVHLTQASRSDHPVSLSMQVAIGGRWEDHLTAGVSNPAGSTVVRNAADAKVWIEEGLTELAGRNEVAAALAAEGATAPATWFETLAKGARVGSASLAFHCHEGCSSCGTQGIVHCGNTQNAIHAAKTFTTLRCATPCYACYQTGRLVCNHCVGGTEHVRENYWDNAAQCTQYRNYTRTCVHCHGSGRSASFCFGCLGAGVVACAACGGSGEVRCGNCSGKGWLTRASVGWLEARPERTYTVAGDAPRAVSDATKEWGPVKTLSVATPGTPAVSHGSGWVHVVIPVKLPHIRLGVAFGNVAQQTFDFVGVRATPWRMPLFLEDLLRDRLRGIVRHAHGRAPLQAVTLAQGARLTRAALDAAVGGREMPSAAPTRWQGAIGDETFVDAACSLRTAYDRLGAATSSRVWKVAALPLLAWAAAVPALSLVTMPLRTLGFPPIGINDPWAATTAATALMPVLLAWSVASHLSRARVRKLTGEAAARRRPAQGVLGKLVPVLTLLCFAGGTAPRLRPDLLPPAVTSALARVTPLEPNAARSETPAPFRPLTTGSSITLQQPPAPAWRQPPHRP